MNVRAGFWLHGMYSLLMSGWYSIELPFWWEHEEKCNY